MNIPKVNIILCVYLTPAGDFTLVRILKWSDILGFRNRALVNKLLLGMSMKCSQVGFKLRQEGVCLKKEYLMIWAQYTGCPEKDL